MSDPRRQIAQEEFDKALGEATRLIQAAEEAPRAESQTKSKSGGQEGVGVHIRADRAVLVKLTGDSLAESLVIHSGYEELPRCLGEIESWLGEHTTNRTRLFFTLSGPPVRSLFIKAPSMSPQMKQKAFQLQMKQALGKEPDNLFSLSLSPSEKQDAPSDYVLATVERPYLDAMGNHSRSLRRTFKGKVAGWDLDGLCYARAADFLWKRLGIEASTRFIITLEWKECHLILTHPSGHFIVLPLAIGIESFMQHLVTSRVSTNLDSDSLEENEDRAIPSALPLDVRAGRMAARQAIHDVYVPFSQQVKTQLYATCNEFGIPLPTHFVIFGDGSSILDIAENLGIDFGIVPVRSEKWIPAEGAAGFGAVFDEKSTRRLNFFPKGQSPIVAKITDALEKIKQLSAKLPRTGELTMDGLSPKKIAIIALLFALPLMYGYGSKLQADRFYSRMEKARRALDSVEAQNELAKKREERYSDKIILKKLIKPRLVTLSPSIRELISILPKEIKLQSLGYKVGVVDMKGSATSPKQIQDYLKSAQKLKTLSEPTPIGMLQQGNITTFEISFQMKH